MPALEKKIGRLADLRTRGVETLKMHDVGWPLKRHHLKVPAILSLKGRHRLHRLNVLSGE
jgi:hypothetical protein